MENGQFTVPSRDMHSFEAVAGYQGSSGAIWYRMREKLRLVKNGEMTSYSVPLYAADNLLYPQLYEDRGGRLWIGTGQPELLMLEGGRLTRYTSKDGLPTALVTTFCEDGEGALWCGTDAGGVARFKDGKFTTQTVRDGLPSNRITTIYQDREGTLWIGTYDSGVAQLERKIITPYSDREGLPGKSYYPVLESGDGSIWIGGAGLYRLKDGRFSYYPLTISPEAHKRHSTHKEVTALYEDRDGKLWIGADVDLFSLKEGQFNVETYALGFDFSHTQVNAILRDSHGVLWFGTRDGLIAASQSGLRLYLTADGLPSEEVHALCEDRNGVLWIGSYGGLARLSNGRLTAYTLEDGLSGSRVRTIYEDGEGTLWIGTYDGGLNRFKNGRFTRYTTSEGLFSNGVFQILEDDAANLWMSSNRGIFRVSRGQLNEFADGKITTVDSIAYGTADGMPTAECNGGRQPAGIRARDGRFWFPTIHGVAVVDPKAAPLNLRPPPVLIEGAFLAGKELSPGQKVRLSPGQQGLEIRYQGLSFIKPDHVRFRYKMDGLDAGWTDAGTDRSASYPHLPPGKYTFRVIAANSDGVWNEEGAQLAVTVVPYFWQTGWFAVLGAVAVLVAATLGYGYRVRRLTRAKTAQEEFSRRLISSQEGERKRIAAELHDSLGQDLIIIKNWATMAKRRIGADSAASEPLDEIASAVSRSIEQAREIAYNLRPYHLDEIGLRDAMQSMVERAAQSSGISFAVDIDPLDGLFSAESEINLFRIVQESVNNILKHSEATEAGISIRKDLHAIHAVIKDNGKGFEPERVGSETDRGFGLSGITERVRLLGGTLTIESDPGIGTTITIDFPAPG